MQIRRFEAQWSISLTGIRRLACRRNLALAGLACMATLIACIVPIAYALAVQPRWDRLSDGVGLIYQSLGIEWTIVPSDHPDVHVSVVELGWPFRASVRISEHLRDPDPPGGVLIRPSYCNGSALIMRVSEYRPLWLGLIANVAIFTAALVAIRWLACSIRIAVRSRRGLCVCCGYSLQGVRGHVCPECGFQDRS